jgi:hypothetical protein
MKLVHGRYVEEYHIAEGGNKSRILVEPREITPFNIHEVVAACLVFPWEEGMGAARLTSEAGRLLLVVDVREGFEGESPLHFSYSSGNWTQDVKKDADE